MRILLDESLPRELARELAGHEVHTVVQMGWAGTKNGELLRRASAESNVFVTADRSLEYQQNLKGIVLGIVVLIARNNRIETLRPLVPHLLTAVSSVAPGQLVNIGA